MDKPKTPAFMKKTAAGGAGFIPFAFPGLPHVGCAFGTALAGALRNAGGSDDGTEENRRKALRHLGLERWVELKQTHGDRIVADPLPTDPGVLPLIEADGSCTGEKGLGLLVKTADCQPLLLTDAKGSAVAALHVGWRGNILNVPAKGLALFCERYGLAPSEVMAVRGPSLGPGAAEFVNFEREWPEAFRPWFNPETRRMDLWSLTRYQLLTAGMPPGAVFSLDLCTSSLPETFFSHRRGHSGRQGALIWLKGDE
ncbi:MAG: polyphenol oxidase family protein [Desulfovibrio sp.]|jgi:YfiH family protein|nr:polyphenol oxidase family protein [Desulfovibrio sp.]